MKQIWIFTKNIKGFNYLFKINLVFLDKYWISIIEC